MDTYRAIIAIVLAFFVLLGYQYLFVAPEKEQQVAVEETVKTPQQRQIPGPSVETAPPPPLQLSRLSSRTNLSSRPVFPLKKAGKLLLKPINTELLLQKPAAA